MAKAPLLEVKDLAIEVSTRRGPAKVVEHLNFMVKPGEALGVVGESGCGKSITMLGMMGLLPPGARVVDGTATLEGRDLLKLSNRELRKVRGGQVGFVFQDPMTSFNPVMTIGDQLIEPLLYHRAMSKADAWKRAGELMRLVGIPGGEKRLSDYPHQLSGGMRQRVMIAMGLACDPSLLIADEPTTALDVTIQAQILDLVKDLRARLGMAVVWITHDLALVSGLVDRIIVLYAGRIVEEADVDDLYKRPSHPYTIGLLGSLPRLHGPEGRRLASIGGTPPEPGRRPKGCAFAPRCSMKIARCETEEPQLAPLPGSTRHRAACWVAGTVSVEAAA
ncbi:peptide/nickel transport system ATP-binding protein [Kaistia dalseonensis]|uniref:Peptide/nickel transport system ATP-binding protein n=2 Tax=Kaistia dalseonensis TaxID=410840 RepID=A0ABU0HAJ2_9HYPH|nr:peptide/nickel transport system ATP-binding protein [Kaistia dalseonensis]